MPRRLAGRPPIGHIQHWTNKLHVHDEGRRWLQRKGYSFAVVFRSNGGEVLHLSEEDIVLLGRFHLGVVVE